MKRWLGCGLSVGLGQAAVGLLLVLLGGEADARAAEAEVSPVAAATVTASLLLVPDSDNDRVMAFHYSTGELIDVNYIPASPSQLSTPKNAILNAAGDTVLVSDQVDDVVQAFDLAGHYLGVFAPAGGVNNAILDNNTGLALRPNGNVLVAVISGANASSVAEFDPDGNYLGSFIAAGSGGLNSPFDILARGTSEWLVTDIVSDVVNRYHFTTGAFQSTLAGVDNFPQQLALAGNGNLLVANFSGSQTGILEFTPGGALVDVYTATGLSGYRGVYELPGGNLLVSTGSGVYELSRFSNTIVDTKISGVSAQYIERVEVPVSIVLTKTVGTNPGTCATTNTISVPALTTVFYCYEVLNTGGLPLDQHDLDDDQLGLILENFDYILQPGVPAFITQSVLIKETTVNSATWEAYNPGLVNLVSASDTATVVVSSTLSLRKTVGTNPGLCATATAITLTVPGSVTYCYQVTNGTALSLTRHSLSDDRLGIILNNFPYTLTPGVSVFVTQTAFVNGTTINTAVWTGFNPGPTHLLTSTAMARVIFISKVWLPLLLR